MTILKSVYGKSFASPRGLFCRGAVRVILASVMLATAIATAPIAPARADLLAPGDFVLRYDPANGNMKLVFTGSGAAGSGPISLQELNILTLGNDLAGNPAMPAGIPNVTPGQGGLNGARATLPAASFQTFNTGSNSDGINGIYSQIYNASLTPATWITFDKTNPGASDTLDLGNVAATGWSQANINAIFMTDPDLYGGDRNFGNFGYAAGDGELKIASVQAVPEPSTVAMLGAGAGLGVAGMMRRKFRRRQATRSGDATAAPAGL